MRWVCSILGQLWPHRRVQLSIHWRVVASCHCERYNISLFLCAHLKVTPPEVKVLGRGRSATVFGSGPNLRVVVLFGGGLSNRLYSQTTLYILGELK